MKRCSSSILLIVNSLCALALGKRLWTAQIKYRQGPTLLENVGLDKLWCDIHFIVHITQI